MHQFYVKDHLDLQSKVVFDQETTHQINKVLKLHAGESIYLCNTQIMALAHLEKGAIELIGIIDQHLLFPSLKHHVTLIQALIRKDKFELILQKATELGVSRIVPLIMERNVVKWDQDSNKLQRYRSILKEASEQCHRISIPELSEPITLKNIASFVSEQNFVAYEGEDPNQQLKTNLHEGCSISIVIGPEGGISPHEMKQLTEAGFKSISLGNRTYRAETAAMVAINTIDCVLGL